MCLERPQEFHWSFQDALKGLSISSGRSRRTLSIFVSTFFVWIFRLARDAADETAFCSVSSFAIMCFFRKRVSYYWGPWCSGVIFSLLKIRFWSKWDDSCHILMFEDRWNVRRRNIREQNDRRWFRRPIVVRWTVRRQIVVNLYWNVVICILH